MRRLINLRLFDGEGDGQNGGAGSSSNNNGTYTYEQLEEIAGARVQKAERAALAGFFRGQGMTEEEVTEAIKKFKSDRQAQQPDVAGITKERDDARAELATYKNKSELSKAGVPDQYTDFVMFEVNKRVDDKTDFGKALKAYLKENPQYAKQGYRADNSGNGSAGGRQQSQSDGGNSYVNDMIRKAARRF